MPENSKAEPSAIPDAFLRNLEDRFGFDAFRPDLRKELDYIARRYRRDLRLFDAADDQKAERLKYSALREHIEALQQMLASPEYTDFGSEIYLTLRTALPDTQVSGLSQLPAPNGAAGEHILQLLERLLALSAATATNVEQRNTPAKGRKPNFALECLVRNVAYLWADILKRPFTLDYHKGSGVTEAFAFVKAIANFVDPETADTKLITSMRTIISERGNIRNQDNA